MPPARLAVVVPTLDEEKRLGAALALARTLGDEVVVTDGGSRDGTAAVARAAGARFVAGPPGRGGQLNRGAAATEAELLLFLHADTHLPESAGAGIRAALKAGAVGGGFRIRFDNPRLWYGIGSRVVNLRTRWTRSPLGDQAQFCHREAFEAAGGFPDWPILEDLEFIRRLKRLGRMVILPGPAVTSARRFEALGIPRALAFNWLIFALYFLGASPAKLARLYARRSRGECGRQNSAPRIP